MRVAVAMSGGVDSLRAAILLKEQGHDVFGLHMRLLPESPGGRWSAERDFEDRRRAMDAMASRLCIAITVVDMREAFEKWVIRPFTESYENGLTPNPCVLCNPKMKFGLLLDEALRLGADRIATGHYARILPPDDGCGRFRLCRGRDARKDQSYFLFGLTQSQMKLTLLPLGDALKRETQQWAEASGFTSLVPEESQEICFIPSGTYQEFLQERLEGSPLTGSGPILDMEGRRLGEHNGLFAYTIGQRRGLGIASSAPYYVVHLEPATNTVRVGRADDLYRSELGVDNLSWASILPPSGPIRCQVRIRNQHQAAPALVSPADSQTAHVRFDEPQRAVTPGQAAVFYQGDCVLGGGVIRGDEVTR